MITLRINGFRCYGEAQTFTFSSGEIVRIKGRSGVGKTTIFEAIQWVLYNYPTTNIYPRQTGANKNTHVTLILPYKGSQLQIDRHKNPSRLLVTYSNGHQEEDTTAQASINSLFGTKDIWRVCCYLPQSENCPLLGFSNQQRMEILEALAFLNERPEEDLNKISAEIARLEKVFRQAEWKLNDLGKDLDESQQGCQLDWGILSEDSLAEMKTRQEAIEDRIRQIRIEVAIIEERKKQRRVIEERLRKLQLELSKLPAVTSPDELEEEIKRLQAELPYSKKGETREKLQRQYQDLTASLSSYSIPEQEYSQEDYLEALAAEKKLVEEKKVASQWQIEYKPEIVSSRLKIIKTALESQKDLQTWQRIKAFENKLKLVTGPEVSISEIEKAKEELKTLERSVDILKCPSCRRNLRLIRNNLALAEASPVPVEKIESARVILTQMEANYQKSTTRSKLKIQIDSLLSTVPNVERRPDRLLTETESKKLQQEHLDLSRLTFPSPPAKGSREIHRSQEYFNLKQKLDDVTTELNQYPQVDRPLRKTTEIMAQLSVSQTKLRQCRDNINRCEVLLKQIKTYQEDLTKLPLVKEETFQDELVNLQQEATEITTRLDINRRNQDYLHLEEKYLTQEDQVKRFNLELAAALRLKDLAQQEICDILDDKITSVNAVIAEICTKVFPEPIGVELAMTKTTKTTKVNKPHVHLKIWYQEGEYDSLSQLSGGEGKRISIAVSLALAQLNNFPMILMDECLNGLDEELKELTLEVFRETIGTSKTVACIMHDGVEGTYDRLLTIPS